MIKLMKVKEKNKRSYQGRCQMSMTEKFWKQRKGLIRYAETHHSDRETLKEVSCNVKCNVGAHFQGQRL
jgi:hypothetical protein